MNVPKKAVEAAQKLRRRRLPGITDPATWVLFCGAAIITVVIIGTSFVVGHFRERAIERSETELESISQILAEHFDQKFDELTAPQNFIASHIERQGLSAAAYATAASSGQFNAKLKDAVGASADGTARVNLFDQQGSLIASSDFESATLRDISGQSYFATLKAQSADADLTLIELVPATSSEGKRVAFARKLSAPNGQLLGAIARVVPSLDLDRFLSSTSVKDRTTILVTDTVGTIGRQPSDVIEHGGDFFNQALLKRVTAATAATLRLIDPQTDDRRIISSRRLARYPVTVVTATTEAAALATWRDETRVLILIACLTAFVTGTMMFVVVRNLKEQTRRLDVAINNMPQALLLFDPLERLVVKNTRYSEMFDHAGQLVTGRRFRDIIRDCSGASRPPIRAYCDSVREALWQNGRTQEIVEASDGRFLQIVNQALDEGGWVSTIEDVTERQRAQELTVRLAQYDSLTALPNRASFMSHLRQELTRLGHDQSLAVLVVDLDGFKSVNDDVGHYIADELLMSIAQDLKASLLQGEFIARLGGDEFAIVSSTASGGDGVLDLIKRVQGAIRHAHQCGDHSLSIDASIGVALAPDDGQTCESILQSADLAMYTAKAQGKKSFRFFEPEMEAHAKERLQLENELRRALTDGQIETHFQPIYDLRRNRIVACEALARWRHPVRGLVSPAIFIPIAEQAGLIGQLGDIVMQQACHEAMNWPSDIAVAVNVSPIQLQSPIFSLKVISALYDSGLPAKRLELEITEAVLIADDQAALKILLELRGLGVRVALDDFGTGYSALSYLLRFPLDKIKIDRRFVEGITERDVSRGIVKAVVTLASDLRMVTTAEGVECEDQRDALRRLGCDQIQGHLIAAALPAAEISEMFETEMREKA